MPHDIRSAWFKTLGQLALILALAVVPTLSAPTGQPPLQLVALALILLVVLAHGLAWEFMMEPDQRSGAASH